MAHEPASAGVAGLPEGRWHDSDERVSIEMLVNGAVTLAHLWQRLGSGEAH